MNEGILITIIVLAVLDFILFYFIIYWAVGKALEESQRMIREAVKKGIEDYYNENENIKKDIK